MSLSVVGLGLVSSLGRDVITSCAAARAGVLRLCPLEGLDVVDPETADPLPVTGHPVKGLTDGFAGMGRLIRLGVPALREVAKSVNDTDWNSTGMLLNLPSGFHTTKHLEEQSEDTLPTDGESLNLVAYRNDKYRQQLIPKLLRMSGVPLQATKCTLYFGDQAGIVQLLQDAAHLLSEGGFTRIIVGGIDSAIEPETLAVCNQLQLLRLPTRQAGFIPGEASAFALLQQDTHANKADAITSLCGWSRTAEPFDRFSDEPILGSALSQTLMESLADCGGNENRSRLIVGNLTGDPYRATDWGHSIVRLQSKYAIADSQQWHPAIHFGEIGASTGFVSICLAARAFSRGYTRAQSALCWLSNDDGTRASFCVMKP